MVSPNVSKIYRAVETLTDAERDELRRLLESRANRASDSLSVASPQSIAEADQERRKHRRQDFQPIELPGGPLSDDIIRDRR